MNKKQRYSGVLMHISSLQGADMTGTLGVESYQFVDFLHHARSKVWQILPLGRTDNSHSPYQCYSSFAGNEYYIDLAFLHGRGWLPELPTYFGNQEVTNRVDWDEVKKRKRISLLDAFEGFRYQNQFDSRDYLSFWERHRYWLEDYSLFMALTEHYEGLTWDEWPEEISKRNQSALSQAYYDLESDVLYHRFVQYVFFMEWELLRQYASSKSVEMMGDLPLYVAYHSADVWVHPDQFQLNDAFQMVNVGGVPPDSFNDQGQHWGNPLFDWDQMAKDNYQWWCSRLGFQLHLYDRLRIDHFRGLSSYYAIEASRKDGIEGEWMEADGLQMLSKLPTVFHDRIIAEDLGVIDKPVVALRDHFQFDGMGVFQFGFNGDRSNVHLPMHYSDRCCAYIGTHDNPTYTEWVDSLAPEAVSLFEAYVGTANDSFKQVVRLLMQSHANGVILQMQDLLGLGESARMNTPGTIIGNWQWRMTDKLLPEISWLQEMIDIYDR
ncbi:4-alpha-glucanotransferase [Halosquirtibacter xylanolyticus]|uniref:4-alpha-glucanotransferase n=1 Tax=Halosquirtibacter xylanolyticus TaxID=3374599 RepID=UPI0037489DCC|nr:4-alpha-glucanotransferase [Prolixibacteraceae bacterium]